VRKVSFCRFTTDMKHTRCAFLGLLGAQRNLLFIEQTEPLEQPHRAMFDDLRALHDLHAAHIMSLAVCG
jgi:hypothetical protein